jgi:hypothetical protein
MTHVHVQFHKGLQDAAPGRRGWAQYARRPCAHVGLDTHGHACCCTTGLLDGAEHASRAAPPLLRQARFHSPQPRFRGRLPSPQPPGSVALSTHSHGQMQSHQGPCQIGSAPLPHCHGRPRCHPKHQSTHPMHPSWACMHVGMHACIHACGMHVGGRCRTHCKLSPIWAALTSDAC